MRTHYDNLHVSEKAAPEVIRGAYRALAQKWHPDKHPNQREKAERYFKIITRAFDVLSDTKARAAYDSWLADQRNTAKPIPEVEPAKDLSKQSLRQKYMAEAWEDGRRSREQGFKVSDCPYGGDFALEWRRGFDAFTPETVAVSRGSSSVKSASKLLWAVLTLSGVQSLFYLSDASSSVYPLPLTLAVLVGTMAVMAFLIAQISEAKAWARNTYLILFLIGLPMQFLSIPSDPIPLVLTCIQFAFQVAALILLFSAPPRRSSKGLYS